MKAFLLSVLIFVSAVCTAQKFVEVRPNSTKYKFPIFEYKKNRKVEEKINAYLQIKHLHLLAAKFDENPFAEIMRSKKYKDYLSWEYKQQNQNIIRIILSGKKEGTDFKDESLFDLRTGDYFQLHDLFTKGFVPTIQKRLNEWVDPLVKSGTLAKLPNFDLRVVPLADSFKINIKGAKTESLLVSYASLDSNLSAYGKNLLLNKSDEIVRRPDLADKILIDTAWTERGSKYERQIGFRILILDIFKDGSTKMFSWTKKSQYLYKYTEASVQGDKITADIYVLDRLKKEKVKMMYSLKLEKEGEILEGSLQTGSLIHPVIFYEY